jgi:hypothetical protein
MGHFEGRCAVDHLIHLGREERRHYMSIVMGRYRCFLKNVTFSPYMLVTRMYMSNLRSATRSRS